MINKPSPGNGWLDRYIAEVEDDSLLEGFKKQTEITLNLFSALDEDQLAFRYAEDKWSIKEIIVHLMDAERIFMTRALTFARGDKTPLPGFDENLYVTNSFADSRDVRNLLEEYIIVRTCTVATFAGMHPSVLSNRGLANNIDMSVAALGFAILGHEIHHVKIIQERYLNNRDI